MSPAPLVAQKLEAAYPALSPRLRKAARYVLKHPAEVALYPLRQVAAGAGVSATTLVRLATDLDFVTYNEFRNAFRDQIRTGAERYAANASKVISSPSADGFEQIYRQAQETLTLSLEELFRTVSAREVARAGASLHAASKIYVVGMGSIFSATYYFNSVLRTFDRRVMLLEDRLGMLIDEIGEMSSSDALLVVSFEPYMQTAVKAAEHATQVGAQVVAVTDSKLSPIAVRSTQTIIVPTASTAFYQSLLPTMALLETIIAYLLSRAGAKAVDRIAAEFERRAQFGLYWQD
ncbi:MAG: MurR/RpiR family transcriptional regulator [Hyphomicrobiaceae bacterium]